MKVQRFDTIPVRALKTKEGFYSDPAAVLTRAGIFTYTDKATGKVTKEYRPPEEVFKEDHLEAFKGLPITDGHHGLVTAKNSKGVTIGAIIGAARADGNNLVAPAMVYITDRIEEDGHKDLSVAYEIDLDETPGEINGERYDAVQRNHRPNSVALCKSGRAGVARLNLDSVEEAEEVVKPLVESSNMKKVRLDNGLEYDAAPEIEVYIGSLQAAVKTANGEKDKQQARADAAEADVVKLKAEVAKARTDGEVAAKARLQLEATATAHKVTFKADSKDLDLKVGVIKVVRGDSFDPAGKTDAYIDAAFDLAVSESKVRLDAAAGQRREAVGGVVIPGATGTNGTRQDGAQDEPEGAAAHRAKYHANLQAGFKVEPAKK
jgi:uncharacterized protein